MIFIAAMMVLILVISFGAVYFFMRTYRKEMAEKEARRSAERAAADERNAAPAGAADGEANGDGAP